MSEYTTSRSIATRVDFKEFCELTANKGVSERGEFKELFEKHDKNQSGTINLQGSVLLSRRMVDLLLAQSGMKGTVLCVRGDGRLEMYVFQ